jgi:hypothetical protein
MEDIDSGLPQPEGLHNGTVLYDPATDYPTAVAHQDISRWLIGEIDIQIHACSHPFATWEPTSCGHDEQDPSHWAMRSRYGCRA